jgi:hypothetical protein
VRKYLRELATNIVQDGRWVEPWVNPPEWQALVDGTTHDVVEEPPGGPQTGTLLLCADVPRWRIVDGEWVERLTTETDPLIVVLLETEGAQGDIWRACCQVRGCVHVP